LGQYATAEPLFQESIEMFRKLGSRSRLTATYALDNLAQLYLYTGEYAKAEPLFQEVYQFRQKLLRKENSDMANVLNNLAVVYEDTGRYAKAEQFFKEALRMRLKVLGKTHPDTAQSLNNLALLYQYMGEYAKAEPLYQQSIEISSKVQGPQHPVTAGTLNNLGDLYYDLGQYAKSEQLHQDAAQIFQKVFGPEHPHTLTCLNDLGLAYQALGQYAQAESLLKDTLRIRQKVLGPETYDTAISLVNLAMLDNAMGENAQAEPLLKEALRIQQQLLGQEHPTAAKILNNLAMIYVAIGEDTQAEPLLSEALRIQQKILGPEHPDTLRSLANLAVVYKDLGKYAKAESLEQESLELHQKILGQEHPDTAQNLFDLAELYRATGQYAKAEPLYQESLRIRQKILGPEHPDTAWSLNSLGLLYGAQSAYAKAEPLFQESLRILQKVWGSEHRETEPVLTNLALLYQATGEYAKAEPLFQEAKEISQKALGPESPDTVSALENLAFCELDLNRSNEAASLAAQVSAAQVATLARLFSFASQAERLAYLNNWNPYGLFPNLPGTETELATAVLRYKGLALDSIVENRLLAEANDASEDQKLAEQLHLDQRQLDHLLFHAFPKLDTETTQQIETLEAEVRTIEGRLAKNVAGHGLARGALDVSVEQVQAKIPDDGALIEYLRYSHYLGKSQAEDRYGAIVLFAKGAPLWIPLGLGYEIEALEQSYAALVRDDSTQENDLSANLQALYEALWAPIGQALPSQIKSIIISPQGELNGISFATLLNKDNEFLAQRYGLRYVASGRDLLSETKPSIAKEVVLFANPDFSLISTAESDKAGNEASDPASQSIDRSEKAEIEDWSFTSLEGTEKETDELSTKFAGWGWTPSVYTKKEATKEALYKIHSPYILHLATYGFFANTHSKFFLNPMYRSGLALAGAQTTIEAWKRDEVPPVQNDGILTAEDVSTLDLKGTWLVTLPACDVSRQATAGEGVTGLRRGFLQAGAQNLLMTLWPIRDDVTLGIMSDFYEAAHNGENAPEALSQVQRTLLVKLRIEKGLVQAVNIAGPFLMSSQ
jgi:tetratricopeptide (TPR) repeat protein